MSMMRVAIFVIAKNLAEITTFISMNPLKALKPMESIYGMGWESKNHNIK